MKNHSNFRSSENGRPWYASGHAPLWALTREHTPPAPAPAPVVFEDTPPARSMQNLGHRSNQRKHALPGSHLAEVSAGKSNRAMKREEHRAHARRMELGTADRVFVTRPGHSELANGRLYSTVEVGKRAIRLTPDSCLTETKTSKVLASSRSCRKYSMPSAESLAYAANIELDALEQPSRGLERPDPIVTAISNRPVRVAQPVLSTVHGCYAIRPRALCHTCLVLQYRYLGRQLQPTNTGDNM